MAQNNTKEKAFAISTLMGNPRLAQAVWDSWDASVGSTKNTKAKSLLDSVGRASNVNNQGMSSAYDQYGQFKDKRIMSANELSALEKDSSLRKGYLSAGGGRGILRGVDDLIGWTQSPTSKEEFKKKGKSRLDWGVEKVEKGILGLGTPVGEALGFAETDVIYPFLNVGSTFMQNIYSWPLRAYDYTQDKSWGPFERGKSLTFDPYRGHLPDKKDVPGSSSVPDKGEEKEYYRLEGSPHVYEEGTNNYISESEAAQRNIIGKNVKVISKDKILPSDHLGSVKSGEIVDPRSQKNSNWIYKQAIKSGKDPKVAVYEAKWQTGFQPNTDLVNQELKLDPKTNSKFGIETFNDNPEDADEIYDNMDNSEQDFWRGSYEASKAYKTIEEALSLGMGSAWTVNHILGDKKLLGAILGLPEEQANALPEGTLQEQLSDLRSALKDEYRINEQKDEMYELRKRDLSINDKFITYIHNKDEYLNEVHGLLKGAEKRIANMDTSNPYVAQRMQMYVNYLTVLQGRQNQRYIDFLDSGIQHHKNEMDTVTLNINRSIDAFNEKWPEVKAGRKEDFNSMKTILEGIVDNIASRDERQREAEEWEWKKTEATDKHIKMTLENAKIENEILGGGGKEVNASTAKMFVNMYRGETNEDGTLNFKTYNPNEVRNSANIAGQNNDFAFNSFMTDMGYTVNKSVGNGSLDQFEKFKKSMISNLTNNIEELPNITMEEYKNLSQKEKTDYESNDLYLRDENQMKTKLQNNLRSGLYDYFSSTEEKISRLREAINELSSIEGWKYVGWYGTSKEDFVKNYSSDFGDLTEKLYGFTSYAKEQGNIARKAAGRKENFTSADVWATEKNKTGTDLINGVLDGLTPYLMY